MKGGGGCPGPAGPLHEDRGQRDGQSRLATEGDRVKERQKHKCKINDDENVAKMGKFYFVKGFRVWVNLSRVFLIFFLFS